MDSVDRLSKDTLTRFSSPALAFEVLMLEGGYTSKAGQPRMWGSPNPQKALEALRSPLSRKAA